MPKLIENKEVFYYIGELQKGLELFKEPIDESSPVEVYPGSVIEHEDRYFLLLPPEEDWIQKGVAALTKNGLGIIHDAGEIIVAVNIDGKIQNFIRESLQPDTNSAEYLCKSLDAWEDIKAAVETKIINDNANKLKIYFEQINKGLEEEPLQNESFSIKQPKIDKVESSAIPQQRNVGIQSQKTTPFRPADNKIIDGGIHAQPAYHQFSVKNNLPHSIVEPRGEVFDGSKLKFGGDDEIRKYTKGTPSFTSEDFNKANPEQKHKMVMDDLYRNAHKEVLPNFDTSKNFYNPSGKLNAYNEAVIGKVNDHIHSLGYDYIKHHDGIDYKNQNHNFFTATHPAAPISPEQQQHSFLQNLKDKASSLGFLRKKDKSPKVVDLATGQEIDLSKIKTNPSSDHKLVHVSLNKDSKSEADRLNYHYSIGNKIVQKNSYVNNKGEEAQPPPHLQGKIFLPREKVEYKGNIYAVKSHMDPTPKDQNGKADESKMLVTDESGSTFSVPRGEVKPTGPDHSKSIPVEMADGTKKFHHDLEIGDKVKRFNDVDEVIHKDDKGYLTQTISDDPAKRLLFYTNAADYGKEYKSTHFDRNKQAEEGDEIAFNHSGTRKIRPVNSVTDKGAVVKVNKTDEPILIKHGEYQYTGNKEHEKARDSQLNVIHTSNPNDPTIDLEEFKRRLEQTDDTKGQSFNNHIQKLDKLAGADKDKNNSQRLNENEYVHKLGIGDAGIRTKYDPNTDTHSSEFMNDKFKLNGQTHQIVPAPPEDVKKGKAKSMFDDNTIYVKNLDRNSKPQPWDIDNLRRVHKESIAKETAKQAKEKSKGKAEADNLPDFDSHIKLLNKNLDVQKFPHRESKSGDDKYTHSLGIDKVKIVSTKNENGKPDIQIKNPDITFGKKNYKVTGYNAESNNVTIVERGSLGKGREVPLDQFKDFVGFHENQHSLKSEEKPKFVNPEDSKKELFDKISEHAFANGITNINDIKQLEDEKHHSKIQSHLNQYSKDLDAAQKKGSILEPNNYQKPDKFNFKEEGTNSFDRALGPEWKENLQKDLIQKTEHKKEVDKASQEYQERQKEKIETKQRQDEIVARNKDLEKKGLKDYTDNIYNKLPSIHDTSLNHKLGIKAQEKNFSIGNSEEHDKTPFEYHIINKSDVHPSHMPDEQHSFENREKIGSEKAYNTPMHLNENYPPYEDSHTQLRKYHGTDIEGKNSRQYIISKQADEYNPDNKHTLQTIGDHGPSVLGSKNEVMGGNGGDIGQRILSKEQKEKNYDHLKKMLPMYFPEATAEQLENLKSEMDNSLKEKGDYPEIYRVAKTKDGEYYDFGKHSSYPGFTKVLNDPNTKYKSEDAEAKAVEAMATPELRKEFYDLIPKGQTMKKFTGNMHNVKKVVDKAVDLGWIPKHNYGEYYNENGPTNKGRQFAENMFTGGYFTPETNEFIKGLPADLRKKVEDIKQNHIDTLSDIQREYPAYDLRPEIENYIKQLPSEHGQLHGQTKMIEESPREKGLKYLLGQPLIGDDDNEGQKEILDKYHNRVKKLVDNINPNPEQSDLFNTIDPDAKLSREEFLDKFFKQYADLHDIKKRHNLNKAMIGTKFRLFKGIDPKQTNMFPQEGVREGLKFKYPTLSRAAEEHDGPNYHFATRAGYQDGYNLSMKYDRKTLRNEIQVIKNGGKGWQEGMPKLPYHDQMNNLVKFYNHINEGRKNPEWTKHPTFFDESGTPVFKNDLEKAFYFEKGIGSYEKNDKGIPEIASVAVIYGPDDKKYILMGKRADSGKWTLPGGHMEDKETPVEGGVRELEEETGIVADKNDLLFIGEEEVVNEKGKKICVYAFMMVCKDKTTTRNDPDEEIEGGWKWIDITNGLPEEINNNLHAPKNVTLGILGLQEQEKPQHLSVSISIGKSFGALKTPVKKENFFKKATTSLIKLFRGWKS